MRMVRLNKHQLNYLLNGEEHWMLQGQYYEAHEAPEDIVKKLRNAAWYRGITVKIQQYPDRLWVKADEPAPGSHVPRTQYRSVESRLDALEKKVVELEKEVTELSDRLRKLKEG